MRRFVFVVICFAFLSISSIAQPSSAGDIMFVAFNSDGNDDFAFVTLVDIPAGTTINFTDDEWNGTAITTGEGEIQWENTTGSTITQGTVIEINNITDASRSTTIGTLTTINISSWNLAGSNEGLFAFTGERSSPGTFLCAIFNDLTGDGSTLTGTGLALGTTAIDFASDDDVIWYTGSTSCNGTKTECQQMIANVSNWSSDNGTGDQSASMVVPGNFSGSALPVELIEFSANTFDNTVELFWLTATEVNNYGFQVQRQKEKDQNENLWEDIGFVEGQGTKNSPTSYSFVDENLPNADKVSYRLKQIDIDGNYDYSKVVEVDLSAITGVEDDKQYTFALEQNYPNPFNPVTTISYTIPNVVDAKSASGTNAKLIVYNMLGQQVRTLVNEVKPAGNYQVQFDGSNLPSGIYFYTLSYGEFLHTHKLVLLK